MKSIGGEALKLIELNKRGFPDRTILIDGRIGFLELKRGNRKNKPDPLQAKKIEILNKLGFDADVANTPQRCIEFIDEMLA